MLGFSLAGLDSATDLALLGQFAKDIIVDLR
jgi:hypothetical protein